MPTYLRRDKSEEAQERILIVYASKPTALRPPWLGESRRHSDAPSIFDATGALRNYPIQEGRSGPAHSDYEPMFG